MQLIRQPDLTRRWGSPCCPWACWCPCWISCPVGAGWGRPPVCSCGGSSPASYPPGSRRHPYSSYQSRRRPHCTDKWKFYSRFHKIAVNFTRHNISILVEPRASLFTCRLQTACEQGSLCLIDCLDKPKASLFTCRLQTACEQGSLCLVEAQLKY